MKKIDWFISTCLVIGIILTIVMFVAETIIGTEIVLIRVLAAAAWIIALVGGNYSVGRFTTPVERCITREIKEEDNEEK